ncbi:MAG: dihydrodipicolinate synthase [Dehalococcoidia bacterium]|nr:dihydrodipicolinate synthase [Dehalococcoidia bacterium]
MPGPIICAKCGKALTLWEIDHGHKCRLDIDSSARKAVGNNTGGTGQGRLDGNGGTNPELLVCPSCGQRSLSHNMNLYECLNGDCKRNFSLEDLDTKENTSQSELICCKHCDQQFSRRDFETHLKLLARSARRGAECLQCGEPTYYLSHDGVWECLNPRCRATNVEKTGTFDSQNANHTGVPVKTTTENVKNLTLICPDCGFKLIWDDISNIWRCSNCRRVYAKEDISKGESVIREIPVSATSPPKGKSIRWLFGSVATLCVVGGIVFFAFSNGWLGKKSDAQQPFIPAPTVAMPLTPAPSPALPSPTPTQIPTPYVTATPMPYPTPTRMPTISPTPTPHLPTPTPAILDKTVTIDGQQYRVQFWQLNLKGRVEATVALPSGESRNYGSNWSGFTLEQVLDNATKSGNKVAWAVALAAGVKEATGSVDQAIDVLRLCKDRFAVYSGEDSLTFSLMALGGRGVVSTVANIIPKEMSELTQACLKGDWEKGRKLQFKLIPLIRAVFIETNPIPIKTALSLMGKCRGDLRLPLTPMSKPNLKKLKEVLTAFGLI